MLAGPTLATCDGSQGPPTTESSPSRRDRHGRGLRGALAPSTVPIGRTRAERFDDFVVDAFEQVAADWGVELAGVQVVVEDIPPDAPPMHADRARPAAAVPSRPRGVGLPGSSSIAVRSRPGRATHACGPRSSTRSSSAWSPTCLGIEPDEVDPGAGPDCRRSGQLPGTPSAGSWRTGRQGVGERWTRRAATAVASVPEWSV